jgi:hypothetical protein
MDVVFTRFSSPRLIDSVTVIHFIFWSKRGWLLRWWVVWLQCCYHIIRNYLPDVHLGESYRLFLQDVEPDTENTFWPCHFSSSWLTEGACLRLILTYFISFRFPDQGWSNFSESSKGRSSFKRQAKSCMWNMWEKIHKEFQPKAAPSKSSCHWGNGDVSCPNMWQGFQETGTAW